MVRKHLPPVREKPEEVVQIVRDQIVVCSYVGGLVKPFERWAASVGQRTLSELDTLLCRIFVLAMFLSSTGRQLRRAAKSKQDCAITNLIGTEPVRLGVLPKFSPSWATFGDHGSFVEPRANHHMECDGFLRLVREKLEEIVSISRAPAPARSDQRASGRSAFGPDGFTLSLRMTKVPTIAIHCRS